MALALLLFCPSELAFLKELSALAFPTHSSPYAPVWLLASQLSQAAAAEGHGWPPSCRRENSAFRPHLGADYPPLAVFVTQSPCVEFLSTRCPSRSHSAPPSHCLTDTDDWQILPSSPELSTELQPPLYSCLLDISSQVATGQLGSTLSRTTVSIPPSV